MYRQFSIFLQDTNTNCSHEKTVMSLADKKCDFFKDLGTYVCNLFIQCNLSITDLTEGGGVCPERSRQTRDSVAYRILTSPA